MIYAENILLCIAIPLLLSMFFTAGSARRFTAAFLTGMVCCLLSAYVSSYIHYISGIRAEDTSIYISPFVEEGMKFLPLVFLLYVMETGEETLLLFAIGIGTGFATLENSCYILTSGAERLSYVLIRGLAVGVMHFVSIFALALCLVIVRRLKAVSFAGVMGALTMSMTFHGLYNLLVSGPQPAAWMGYVLPVLTAVILYIPYRRMHPGGRIDPDGA